MKYSKILFLFIVIYSVGLMSFNLSPRLQKKVSKEIKLAFNVEKFSLEKITVSSEINEELIHKINGENFFKINNNQELIGYAFIEKAPSKTDEFDYLVLFDASLIIKKAKVLVYREDYGGEIGSKRWLKQFIGRTKTDRLKYEKDIIAISGATISANSMTIAVNNLLQTIEKLHRHKVI